MSGGIENQLAAPACGVDVYPFESGTSYKIAGGQVLDCRVTKPNNPGDGPGTAQIVLAPGGPRGVATSPSWAEVITLQSLVVVSLARGTHANVVFVGVVKAVGEGQRWMPGRGVVRTIQVQAHDWASWFFDFTWASLSYLAMTNGAAYEEIIGQPTDTGLVSSVLSAGQLTGNPADIANGWFTKLMGGTQGILSQTRVAYGNGLLWPAATTSFFARYPDQVVFPSGYMYLAGEGTWWDKFRAILDWPFYETLIGTAPQGTWFTTPQASAGQVTAGGATTTYAAEGAGQPGYYNEGTSFASQTIPNAVPAQVQVVGRLMPMPDLTLAGGMQASQALQGQPAYTLSSDADLSLWQALPPFTLDYGQGFIESQVQLSQRAFFNFYMLTPTYIAPIVGLAQQASQFPYAYPAGGDAASVHRFGFKSFQKDTPWWSDPARLYAQSSGAQGQTIQNLVGTLILRMATYYEPLPLQLEGTVRTPLRPDIFPGCRFEYQPFVDDYPYQFYITGVEHRWQFGGPSTTTLQLDRGMPAYVYDNASLMGSVLQGNAQRVNGVITAGLPAGSAPGLQIFQFGSPAMQAWLGEVAGIYGKSQAQ